MKQEEYKYTTQDALDICVNLEPIMASIGYHCGIGGSLVYRGWSNKDIDIIIYTHQSDADCDRSKIVNVLRSEGFKEPSDDFNASTMIPDVWSAEDNTGRRIDFFFMIRSPFEGQKPTPLVELP